MPEPTNRRAVCQLCFAEQLLVWGTRTWLTGPDGRARLQAELMRALGTAEGHATAAALGAFADVLDSAALRTIYIGPMTCRMVWPDEERILAVIHYLQSDLPDAAEHVLEPVLPPAARRAALQQAELLAGSLADAGYRIGFDGPLAPELAAALPRLGPTIH
ncbi:MAG TPA: hypothetical protein VF274_14400 [Alphaproteobacteria bacterium]|jgi:hypothetical protein